MPGTASYTQRTLEFCKRCGWRVGEVDRRSPPAPGQRNGKTHDYLGIGDMLALDDLPGSLLIQSTSLAQVTAHRRKYERGKLDEHGEVIDPDFYTGAIRDWLRAGNRFVLWGWWQRDTRIDRTRWTFRDMSYGLVDGQPAIVGDTKDARPIILAAAEDEIRLQIPHGDPPS